MLGEDFCFIMCTFNLRFCRNSNMQKPPCHLIIPHLIPEVTSNNHNLGPGCHPRPWPQHPLAAAAGRCLWQRNRAFQQHPACPGHQRFFQPGMRLMSGCVRTAGFSSMLKWHVEQELYRPLKKSYKRTSEEPKIFSKKHLFLFPFLKSQDSTSESPLYITLYKPKKTLEFCLFDQQPYNLSFPETHLWTAIPKPRLVRCKVW